MKKYVLISVTEKTGIYDFANALLQLSYTIVASEGTHEYFNKLNVPSISTTSLTRFPPIMKPQGVKTLHPIIHGGIFADRKNKEHLEDAERFNIPLYDIVVCNFYSFERVLQDIHSHADAIRNIDIGGPTMVRAAAKNYKNVIVVTDILDYDKVIQEIKSHKGNKFPAASEKFRRNLAIKAFEYTRLRDDNIIKYLKSIK